MPTLLQSFGLSVVLKKLVHRDNSMAGAAASKQKQIDLTPYLGEYGSVSTIKSLGQPAGGFTISFPDQLAVEIQDTLYGLIEPMDLVEIRAARHQKDFSGQLLPLVMRGFVSSVQRAESIGDDGTPQRQIVVQGLDSGRLFSIYQINFMFLEAAGIDFLSKFELQSQLGLDAAYEPVSDYITKIVDYVNDRIKTLSAFSNKMVPTFSLSATVKQGQAYIAGMSGKNGPIWNFVEDFADRPWNEVFIIDEEEGPRLVFRPAPYKDLDGKFVIDGAVDPGTIDVAQIEAISINVSRSDARVANLYWCPPAGSTLDTSSFLTSGQIANALPIDTDYPNDASKLYGERILEVTTNLKPNEALVPSTMLPPGERGQNDDSFLSWSLLRAKQLRAMNRDTSLHEEGTLQLNGREDYQIGRYLRLTRGSVISECYIDAVANSISPLRSWTTTVTVKRGMGFYARDQAANVPFWAEGRPGAYS